MKPSICDNLGSPAGHDRCAKVRGCRARTAAAIAVWLSALAATVPAPAVAAGKSAAFVIDANTGAVISAAEADEPRYPASLTKMMTLYVVFDLIEQGRLSPQTKIRISDTAAEAPPSKLGLEEGSEIALLDAVKVLITRSANDIAVAIAEHIAGSEDKFAALMTQKARAIGMKASTFKNANGLPNDEQVTTARDMVTLGLRLHDDFPKYYPLFATREFRYAGKTMANHNTLLNSYEGTEGIKTGYTRASGYNLVASVKRGSKHVMGAVFGGSTAASRNQTMRTLLNIALFKASPVKTRTPVAIASRARPAPVPQPQPAVRPQKEPVAIAAAAPKLEAPMEAAKPANPAPTTIEIARVRPVLVAPRPPRQAPVAVAEAAPAAASVPADFKLPPLAASAAPSAWGATTQVAAPPAAPLRGSLPLTQKAAAKAGAQMPAAAIAPPTPVETNGIRLGNPPSSLQRQAENLGGAAPNAAGTPPLYRLSGPSAGYEIQVGAFSSAAEAERQLSLVRAKASDLVGNSQAVTHPVTANGKPVWRARFGGFQAAAASTVCTELRRRQFDCLVAKAE